MSLLLLISTLATSPNLENLQRKRDETRMVSRKMDILQLIIPLSDILLSNPSKEVAHIEPLVTLAPHPPACHSLSATIQLSHTLALHPPAPRCLSGTIQSSNTTFVPWKD